MEYIIDYAKVSPAVLDTIIFKQTDGRAFIINNDDIDDDRCCVSVASFEDNDESIFDLVAEIVNPYLFEG